ncbi:site-specific DNA-methyltransferase [Verrucomicrobiales bacterium]|nr:site-specific DNA-methyltransferase [Verrucomicrobiales bacterium]
MDDPEFLPGLEKTKNYPTDFQLHLSDCVAGMKKLKAESVDLVVTSPPYNLGIGYEAYQDKLSSEDYLAWSREWINEVKRVLKADGSLFLNVGASPKNPWMPHELALSIRDILTLQNTIHWIKSITVDGPDGEPHSVGHFKPINSKRFINDCHEFVFHFTKTGDIPIDRLGVGVPYADKSNIKRWGHTGGQDKRCRGNNWYIPYETIASRNKDRPHPATFPTELAKRCIALHGEKPDMLTMMDPFLGIGHAGIAAGEMEVQRFIGYEIDETYLDEAKSRLI